MDVGDSSQNSRDDISLNENPRDYLKKLEDRLAAGSTLTDPESAYVLYCEYGRLKGFSVKKGTQYYFTGTKTLRLKVYLCSCEGKTDNKAANDKIPKYRKQHFRTDCQARLRIVRESTESPWKVRTFATEHNHELLQADEGYLLRSARNLTHAKRSILETFNDAGIGVSQAFRFMEKTAGGRWNVGFTRKDAYDHMTKVRAVTKIQNYDADELLRYFQTKSHDEPYFYWNVSLDDSGRLMNFYFRDCRCADDYKSFGDFVSVDTTFKTNKYNLICTPFIGINHHRQNILFGIAFLSDETTESFEWLFKTFLESMDGKEPEIVMSDQDQALVNAIDSTFTTASRRLCQWHIGKNAGTHFGKLSHDKLFRNMWYRCMNGCETEREFDETWNLMVTKYGLSENRWFANMYTIRHSWADVFVNDKFTAGMRATSRSENANKVIKDLCAASTSLCEFVKHYEGIINGWRQRERDEDVANYGIAGQRLDGNPILEQAAKFYTRNVYHLFESEAIGCLNVKIENTLLDASGDEMSFHLTSQDDPVDRVVTYNSNASTVSCTCQMLVTHGYFCRHILKVYYTLNIETLPEKYLLNRWSKNAKLRSPQSWTNQLLTKDRGGNMVFKNSLMKIAYDLGVDIEDNKAMHVAALDKFREIADEFRKLNEPVVGDRVKRSRKHGSSKKKQQPFKDPPIPKGGWLPAKRRTTVLDKKGPKKGKERNSTNQISEQSPCPDINSGDNYIVSLEDLTSDPIYSAYNTTC